MPHTQRDKMCLPFSHRDTRTAYWFLPWKGSEHAIHGLQSKRFFTPNSKRKLQRRMPIQTSDKVILNYKKGCIYWLVGGVWSILTDCNLVDAYLTTVENKESCYVISCDWDSKIISILSFPRIWTVVKTWKLSRADGHFGVYVLNAMHKFNIERERLVYPTSSVKEDRCTMPSISSPTTASRFIEIKLKLQYGLICKRIRFD